MIIGVDNSNFQNTSLHIPIEVYANKLSYHLEAYLNIVEMNYKKLSNKATEKARISLRHFLFPNSKEFKIDYDNIKNDCGSKTHFIISQYTKSIMQLMGRLAECVIIDRCLSEEDINRICINIALFKENIYTSYSDVSYNDYVAFSPSFKYLIYKNSNGIFQKHQVPDYNPHHPTKDIAWCKKENILCQLKAIIPGTDSNYQDNAKLQIKATLHCENLDLRQYFLTPVLCFDFGEDIEFLKERYPDQIIYSVRQLFPEIYLEMENYFKIIAAYATGLTDHINITDVEVRRDLRLQQLFGKSVKSLTTEEEDLLDVSGVIKLAEKFKKPVIIGV